MFKISVCDLTHASTDVQNGSKQTNKYTPPNDSSREVHLHIQGDHLPFIQWLNGVCRDTTGNWYHPVDGWIQGCDGRVSECSTSVAVRQHCRETCNSCPADTPHTPSCGTNIARMLSSEPSILKRNCLLPLLSFPTVLYSVALNT